MPVSFRGINEKFKRVSGMYVAKSRARQTNFCRRGEAGRLLGGAMAPAVFERKLIPAQASASPTAWRRRSAWRALALGDRESFAKCYNRSSSHTSNATCPRARRVTGIEPNGPRRANKVVYAARQPAALSPAIIVELMFYSSASRGIFNEMSGHRAFRRWR